MDSDKDVFLSHSGKEKNFVRQLHEDLTREHISCFFDEDPNSLPHGEKFPPRIFEACEKCKIAVVVLSNEFIRSKWPLQELSAFVKAMKSGKNIKLMPIFFMISPKELSHITKDNPQWQKFEVSNVRRSEWQDALKEVRSINGWTFVEDGNEVALRKKVVTEICGILRGIKPPVLLEFKPVGIEDQVRELKALLDMKGSESGLAVIVYGFGGVGKSTLAASVVQSLDWSSTDFKFCWVAIDENTPDRSSHIIKLQKYILDVFGGAKDDFQNTRHGQQMIKQALENKNCLLFIDNVVDKVYIKDLLPQNFLFTPETKLRIIITSRENNLKPELNITSKEYEVKPLSPAISGSLLLETILENSRKVEDKDFDETIMINKVAAQCRGVPLLLSVFGKHLRVERSNDSYQEALDALREGNLDSYRDEDLGAKLMFVYNKIKDVDVKEAFLDICTYFHGWEWNLVVDILDFPQLNDLHRRALVSKSSSGKVIVHDILRFMGMKEASLTRFSNLDGFENVKDVKGISVVKDDQLITIQSIQLEAMSQYLRVLMLGNWVSMEGPFCQKAFPNLRYLVVGDITAFPFKDPSKLDKLRVFINRSKPGMNLSHLPSGLKRICHEIPHVECDKFVKLPFQNLNSLKKFTVKTSKPVELPEELYLPSSLVDLDLKRCKNLPKDMGDLIALESLILDESDLEYLPQGFGKLKKLKHLSLNYCSKLAILSEELGMLSSLEALSMNGCEKLTAFPESLAGLISLQKFQVNACTNLTAFPESLGGLLSLQTLEFYGCTNLIALPESLGELRIQSLNLSSLYNLSELPNSFGNMTSLKGFRLISCASLMSLPNSFVQLKLLETLEVYGCTKLSLLPEDFGRLRCLKRMTVDNCDLLKELPRDFGALPALKTFRLERCKSFVNLPKGFSELTSLEELSLVELPLMSGIPDGFGKLRKLRFLDIRSCAQLKTLSDDFENMATLERLTIQGSHELDGAVMEKIVRLPNCYTAGIHGSTKMIEKWEHMQRETEHPIVVLWGDRNNDSKKRDVGRAIGVALLNGKCMEVKDGSDQLMERSSLLMGLELEEGTTATVALIMLPIKMQSNQQETIQRYVKMARERAESNGSGKLQIVCATKVDRRAEEEERATTTEEEESIRQILLSLPLGSCAIPSAESKRLKVLTFCCEHYDHIFHKLSFIHRLSFIMANVGLDIEGREIFENLEVTREDEISANVVLEPPPSQMRKPENEDYNSIQNFIESICPKKQSECECVAGESKRDEFRKALKGKGIHYLLNDNSKTQVMVDDLHGKAIGFIICHFKFLECIKLQQVYKHLQQKDSNFIWIWIPISWYGDTEKFGHGSYTRLIQCMPWATFPDPQLVNIKGKEPCFVVLDNQGQIANQDALPLLLGWGVESYPFTHHTIPESFSLVESESCLEFLLHGMNIVGRKQMKSKMTFLYAGDPSKWFQKKYMELTQIHGSFEVLYVGNLYDLQASYKYIGFKEVYEDETQNMRWPSLSFSDMIMFWNRCKYLADKKMYELYKESNMMMEPLHWLAVVLYRHNDGLLLVDNDGHIVTCGGLDVVQMICESSDGEGEGMRMVRDEVILSLRRGECSPIVKTFFRDEIDNHPQHPQHPIHYIDYTIMHTDSRVSGKCDACGGGCNEERKYFCDECEWYMCRSCWMAYAKQQVEPVKEKEKNYGGK